MFAKLQAQGSRQLTTKTGATNTATDSAYLFMNVKQRGGRDKFVCSVDTPDCASEHSLAVLPI